MPMPTPPWKVAVSDIATAHQSGRNAAQSFLPPSPVTPKRVPIGNSLLYLNLVRGPGAMTGFKSPVLNSARSI